MALLRIRKTGKEITNPTEIQGFLEEHGVLFEKWDAEENPCLFAKSF